MTCPVFQGSRPLAASILGAFLTLSPSALAQEPSASDALADQPPEPEETTPAPDEPGETREPERPGTPETTPETETAREDEPPRLEKPEESSSEPRERAVAAVRVELLPGDAYPAPTTRGIPGGSLWLTMHGLQWPYMPKIAGAPAARLGFSGSAWVDLSYARTDSGRPDTEYNDIRWEQQSRFVLRATPTYSTAGGWFVQGQGEVVLNGAVPAQESERFATDDLYVRAGKWNVFDVTAGRFQGWEIYHYGMALDLNTYERVGPLVGSTASPAQLYGVTHYWDRPNGPGNVAAHVYAPRPLQFLRAELLGQMGNASGLVRLAGRAVVVVDWGMDLPGSRGHRIAVKLKGGGEYGDDRRTEWSEDYEHRIPGFRDQAIRQGWGGSLQFVFDPYVEIGGAYAQGINDRFDNRGELIYAASRTTTSFGGFLNVQPLPRFIVGIGAHLTDQVALVCTVTLPSPPGSTEIITEDCSRNPVPEGENDSWQLLQYFGAVQYEVLPGFFTKLVLAHGRADYNRYSEETPPYTHETGSLFGLPLNSTARLRFMYLF